MKKDSSFFSFCMRHHYKIQCSNEVSHDDQSMCACMRALLEKFPTMTDERQPLLRFADTSAFPPTAVLLVFYHMLQRLRLSIFFFFSKRLIVKIPSFFEIMMELLLTREKNIHA